MRRFDGGRRSRAVVQIVVAVLAAVAFLYAAAGLGPPMARHEPELL